MVNYLLLVCAVRAPEPDGQGRQCGPGEKASELVSGQDNCVGPVQTLLDIFPPLPSIHSPPIMGGAALSCPPPLPKHSEERGSD